MISPVSVLILFFCTSNTIMSMHHAVGVDLNNIDMESSKISAEANAEKGKSSLSSVADNSNVTRMT